MKAIHTKAVITSLRSKVDKSLGLTLSTPELSSKEKAEFMNLQGAELDAFFNPVEGPMPEEMKVEKDLERKSQGQRIRAVLFILWKQEGEEGVFADYYRNKTEKYIEFLKEKIND